MGYRGCGGALEGLGKQGVWSQAGWEPWRNADQMGQAEQEARFGLGSYLTEFCSACSHPPDTQVSSLRAHRGARLPRLGEGSGCQRQDAEGPGSGSQTLELYSIELSRQWLGDIPTCFLTVQDKILGTGALGTQALWNPVFHVGQGEA